MVGGAGQSLAMSPQHGGLVHAVTVLAGQGHDVVHPGSGLQLRAQGFIAGHLGEEGLKISNRHGNT